MGPPQHSHRTILQGAPSWGEGPSLCENGEKTALCLSLDMFFTETRNGAESALGLPGEGR